MKQYISYIIIGILVFHIGLTLLGFYTMFTDFTSFTIYHAYPFMLLAYSILWAGVYYKKRIFALSYLFLSMFEIGIKLFMKKSVIGMALGDVLFPANFVFIAILVLLYNQLFPAPIHKNA